VVEDFPETILILEPMKTVQRLHKRRKQSRKERLETKQPTGIWLSTSKKKNIKIEKEIKDLEKNCTRAIVHGRKVPDNDISKKAKELENINNKIEDREERWFELSAKIEG
jgi:ATP-binding cassette subfamily F protein uup